MRDEPLSTDAVGLAVEVLELVERDPRASVEDVLERGRPELDD
jgi:hypothetical protein